MCECVCACVCDSVPDTQQEGVASWVLTLRLSAAYISGKLAVCKAGGALKDHFTQRSLLYNQDHYTPADCCCLNAPKLLPRVPLTMPLTLSRLISKPLVQYMDTYGRHCGEYYSLQVQALLDTCDQGWFCHVPPTLSRVLLQHIATMCPLEELPCSVAGHGLTAVQPEAEHSSLNHQKHLAYAPFLSFVTEITKLAGSYKEGEGILPMSPLEPACLTLTALFQSALLASKLLACTDLDPSIPDTRSHTLRHVVCGLVAATAKQISISQWVEDEVVDDLPMWLVQSCLKYLRQVIRNHQQGTRSQDAPGAARVSMKLLISLLRPSTQVAALVIEAMYNSGDNA